MLSWNPWCCWGVLVSVVLPVVAPVTANCPVSPRLSLALCRGAASRFMMNTAGITRRPRDYCWSWIRLGASAHVYWWVGEESSSWYKWPSCPLTADPLLGEFLESAELLEPAGLWLMTVRLCPISKNVTYKLQRWKHVCSRHKRFVQGLTEYVFLSVTFAFCGSDVENMQTH